VIDKEKKIKSVKQKLLKTIFGGFIYTFIVFIVVCLPIYNEARILSVWTWIIISFIITFPFYFIRLITLSKKPVLCFIINFITGIPLIPYLAFLITKKLPFEPFSGWTGLFFESIFQVIFKIWIVSLVITLIFFIYDRKILNKIIKKKNNIMFLIGILFLYSFIFFNSIPPTLGVTDINSSNDHYSKQINITSVRDLKISYVNVNAGIISGFVQQSNSFIKEIYPLKDSNLNSTKILNFPTSKIPPSPSPNSEIVDFYNDVFSFAAFNDEITPDRVIGIVEPGWLEDTFPILQGTSGFAIPNTLTAVLENHNRKTTIAHELGHLFLLCDEYSEANWIEGNVWFQGSYNFSCPNANINDYFNTSCLTTPQSGCPSPNGNPMNPYSPLYNFMGNNHNTIRSWISKESYEHLLDSFDISQTNYLPNLEMRNLSGKIVSIIGSGVLKQNGSAKFHNVYVYSTYLFDRFGPKVGDYVIETLDNLGQTLYNKTFEPIFKLFGDDGEVINLSEVPFQFIIPYNENISKIVLKQNDTIILELNVSSNTPNVSLSSPNGGEIFTTPFNVSWNASDNDNDTLIYAILFSDNNGSTWSTIDFDLNETFYEINNANFSFGTQYKIKILASDGFNTGSVESDSNFTIVPPPSVSVESIEEVYSLGGLKVFEVLIENNGGQTLNNLSWRFNTGLVNITNDYNVSLEANENITLLIEYNYSSGGWMNVSLFAWDDNKSVNDTLIEQFFVGDLRVGGFKELYGNVTLRVFEFLISNQGNTTLTNVGWTVNTSDGVVFSSDETINLSPFEVAYVLFEHNFSDTGSYNLTVNVSDDFSAYNRSLDLFIPDIVINDFRIINQSDNIVNFGFGLENMLNKIMNASYTLNSGVQNLTNASIIINPGENINFTVEANYTSYGDFTAILNASDNHGHSTSDSVSVSVNELLISGLQKLSSTDTLAVLSCLSITSVAQEIMKYLQEPTPQMLIILKVLM